MLADLGVGYEHLRRRLGRAALACSFCGRSGLEAVHLIAGPNVYVCEHCVDEASRLVIDDSPGWSGGSLSIADEDQTTTCSFCGKRRAGGTRMISGPGARICTDCLILCREIEAEERTTLNLDRA
jgi:ATP-dependent protease Clp ATPase subunit